MLRPGIHLQLAEHGASQGIARQHALDGVRQDAFRMLLAQLAHRRALDPARIAGVAVVYLVRLLLAADANLLRVDDDDEVAGVHVRRVGSLVLAAQAMGDLARQATEGLALGIDDKPLPFRILRASADGLHSTGLGGLDWSKRTIVRVLNYPKQPKSAGKGEGGRSSIVVVSACGHSPGLTLALDPLTGILSWRDMGA